MRLPRSLSLTLFLAAMSTSLPVNAVGMVTIPAGPFQMGCSAGDNACENDEGPAGGTPVNVPVFEIDTHEVTVSEYMQCIKAGKCNRPKDHQRNKYCNIGAKGRDDHPANCVDWQDAVDYCTFVGKRLPSEPEWEKAARGTDGRTYPWGEQFPTSSLLNFAAIVRDTMPVGSYPDGVSPYGVYDMAGNVWEWMQSEKKDYPYRDDDEREDLDSTNNRVLRGGSWVDSDDHARAAYRASNVPSYADDSLGFRCAR